MKDSYEVILYPKALRDLDGIYQYIYEVLQEPEYAIGQSRRLEDGILSLSELPYRCAERRTGTYANCGYRELIVDNYIVIYCIEEAERQVRVVTVQYGKMNQ